MISSKFLIPCSPVLYSTVRMEGLEPPYLTASDPKSDVSTNFTTSGRMVIGSNWSYIIVNVKLTSMTFVTH